MGLGKAVVVLSLILLAGAAVAYSGGSSSSGTPTSACNNLDSDGNPIDDDGDGAANANDPGCTKPYYADDSERDFYDNDISWHTSNLDDKYDGTDSILKEQLRLAHGPSILHSNFLLKGNQKVWDNKGDPGEICEQVVIEPGEENTEQWAGGEETREVCLEPSGDVGKDYKIVDGESGNGKRVRDAPYKKQCGDGKSQSGENRKNCPEDMGMPSPRETDGSITSNFLKFQPSSNFAQTDHDYSEWFAADPTREMDAREKDGVLNVDWSGFTGDGTFTYDADLTGQKVEFSHSSDEITIHYLTSSYKSKTFTDWDKTGSSSKDTYEHVGSLPTSCDGTDCSGSDRVTSRSGNYVTDCRLEDDTATHSWQAEKYTPNSQSLPDFKPVVEHEDRVCDGSKLYYKNGGKSKVYTCDSSSNQCNTSGRTKVYNKKSNAVSYNAKSDFRKETITIKWEDLDVTSTEVFHIDSGKDIFAGNSHGSFDKGGDATRRADNVRVLFGDDNMDPVFESRPSDGPLPKRKFGDVLGNNPFSIDVDSGKDNYGNDPAASLSRYSIRVRNGKYQAMLDNTEVWDADGPNGRSDGYVALEAVGSSNDDVNIVGSSPELAKHEVGLNFGWGELESKMNSQGVNCPRNENGLRENFCIAYVDFYSKDNARGWGFHTALNNPYSLGSSYGSCKRFKSMHDTWRVNCDYDGSNSGPSGGVSGNDPGEDWIYFEGPEANPDVVKDDATIHQANTQEKEACVFPTKDGAKVVSEGSVRDVTVPSNSDTAYERGGRSPDAEVCLDLEGKGIGNEGDYLGGDNANNDKSDKDFGGEWYDLDSVKVQKFLRSNTNLENKNTNDPKWIGYYWETNPDPDSSENPQGGNEGTALEDECGSSRTSWPTLNYAPESLKGCGDEGDGIQKNGVFWSNFQEGDRDDDYHPQGENSGSNHRLNGYINKVEEVSNQLEPSMDTDFLDSSDYTRWSSSRPESGVDEWAITPSMSWSIGNDGNPYPPYSTYYDNPSERRTQPSQESVLKKKKVYGNSYAAVAGDGIAGVEPDIRKGDGVWIDPDRISVKMLESDDFIWPESVDKASGSDKLAQVLSFDMDITGRDAGLGYLREEQAGYTTISTVSSRNDVVFGDIAFQSSSEMEKPVCGDDSEEYLIEELGESDKSAKYNGRYACVDQPNKCIDMSASDPFFSVEEPKNTDEVGENTGRAKDDREICARPGIVNNEEIWVDQDFSQNACRGNNFFKREAIRWFDAGYVKDNPEAIKGGVDDDWNTYMSNNYGSPANDPHASSGVPNHDKVATRGFCAGDDESEYFITQ
ncbi:MAG: hypothetical protein ABEJ03_01245, partial [Candidatus Nanohaloarchaea archaeon]